MNKETKQKKISLLSKNLATINQKYSNIFLCPVCFCEISIHDLNEISEAHIIPKSAKGNVKTFLCRKCNSQFGANQDKWFGELTKLHNANKDLLETELKGKYFTINGQKVSGKWFTRDSGNLAFVFYQNRNSPSNYDHFTSAVQSDKIKLELKYPILSKEYEIKKGYLTAAYLYMFSIFGYAWVLQSYLVPLRSIIKNNGNVEINQSRFLFIKETFHNPMIGLSCAKNKIYFLFIFNNVITVLPTFSNSDLNTELSKEEKKDIISNILLLNLNNIYEQVSIQLIIYDKKIIMMTDSMKNEINNSYKGLLISENGINLLERVTGDEVESIQQNNKNIIKEIIIDLRNI